MSFFFLLNRKFWYCFNFFFGSKPEKRAGGGIKLITALRGAQSIPPKFHHRPIVFAIMVLSLREKRSHRGGIVADDKSKR